MSRALGLKEGPKGTIEGCRKCDRGALGVGKVSLRRSSMEHKFHCAPRIPEVQSRPDRRHVVYKAGIKEQDKP